MVPFDTGLDKEFPPDKETRSELLNQALNATKTGNIIGALEALYHGYFLDGYYRRLRKKWDALSEDEIYDALAQAVVQLIEKVSKGETVLRPLAYIYKVANGIANDQWQLNISISSTEVEDIPFKRDESEDPPIDIEERTIQALSIAKSLLPKLGQENVQLVMEYIFDAVEQNAVDITNREMSEALMLSPDVVRQCKSRGWRRLERIAKEEGYHIDMSFLNSSSEDYKGEFDE